jgi:transcriptional regulator with XRE-family HTH domain/quercetin dioxygenase-like cupin family protein
MAAPEVPPIGERIRAARVRRGWTVRGLAREIGVSASLISQIETGKSQPSVSSLYAITTALDISVEDLFAAADDEAGDVVAAATPPSRAVATKVPDLGGPVAAGSVAAVLAGLDGEGGEGGDGADRALVVGPVVRPDGREALTLDSGVTWELLGQVPGVHVEFLRVTYPPGSASSSSGQLMRHTGTEYGFLVTGELVLSLGFEEHRLGPGDAISFASSTPHAYRNDGTEPAIGIWFVVEDH